MQHTSHPYHTRIQKGGALLDDMRLLVRSWENYPVTEQISAARSLLGKKTLARTKDTVVRTFIPRFLHGDPPDAWKLVRPLENREFDSELLRPVYYWITARSDRLLYDYVTEELIHVSRSGNSSIRIEETTAWIGGQLKRTNQQWSPTVTVKVARGLLAALRDFGILEGAVRNIWLPRTFPSSHFPI
jgi:hypothetical protein